MNVATEARENFKKEMKLRYRILDSYHISKSLFIGNDTIKENEVFKDIEIRSMNPHVKTFWKQGKEYLANNPISLNYEGEEQHRQHQMFIMIAPIHEVFDSDLVKSISVELKK